MKIRFCRVDLERRLRMCAALGVCAALGCTGVLAATAPPFGPAAEPGITRQAQAGTAVHPGAATASAGAPGGETASAGAPGGAVSNESRVVPLAVQQLAPGVFAHFGELAEWQPRNGGDVANLGFVVGSRCVAVIDTGGTPQIGRGLLAAVRQVTPLPVCYVINTHAHPDHVLGNVAFAKLPGEPVHFVASARMGASLSARERHVLNALQRDFGLALPREAVVYPTHPIDAATALDLGDRQLTVTPWPTAHTDHDLTVLDGKTRTLFLGDLLFAGHLPVLDGKLRGWLAVMASLRSIDVVLAIPGHGPSSADWPAAMAPQQAYLDGLVARTKAALAARMTLSQAVESIAPPVDPTWRLTEAFHRRNVTAAFAELEWED